MHSSPLAKRGGEVDWPSGHQAQERATPASCLYSPSTNRRLLFSVSLLCRRTSTTRRTTSTPPPPSFQRGVPKNKHLCNQPVQEGLHRTAMRTLTHTCKARRPCCISPLPYSDCCHSLAAPPSSVLAQRTTADEDNGHFFTISRRSQERGIALTCQAEVRVPVHDLLPYGEGCLQVRHNRVHDCVIRTHA